MRRRILLVDDEVAILLTLKAVLEIGGFDVDTAASGREGVSRLHTHEYQMLITDMRMEHDEAGMEVIHAARNAAYRPAIALLSAFPVAEEDWQEMGADKLLVKPTHTRVLLEQIERMFDSHEKKLASPDAATSPVKIPDSVSAKKTPARKTAVKKAASKAPKTKATTVKTPAAVKKAATAKKAVAKKATAAKTRPIAVAAKKSATRPKLRA